MMVTRTLTVTLIALVLAAPAAGQERVAVIEGLELYSAFWPNLHHLLHADARDEKNRFDIGKLSGEDRAIWEAALAHYASQMATRDLRTERDMIAISEALSREGPLMQDPALSAEHKRNLEAAAVVYRRHRWADDDRKNRAWIADVSSKLKTIAPRVLPRLATFFRLPWYDAHNSVRVESSTSATHAAHIRGAFRGSTL